MALPITTLPGYYNVLKRVYPNQVYARDVWYESCGQRYKQAQPWDRPLPYSYEFAKELTCHREVSGIVPDVRQETTLNHDRLQSLAYERAFDKLRAQFTESKGGELGITLAQSHLTLKLYKDYLRKFVYMQRIADICFTLDKFAVFVRRAGSASKRRDRIRFRNKAAKVLGVRAPSDREVRRRLDGQFARTALTGFSAEYLAFHYGWSPLFQEIYAQLTLLSEGIPYPKGFYRVGASSYADGFKNSANLRFPEYRVHVVLGAVAEVEHPLIWCANVSGILNPAAIAWDAVPWSFVYDWVLSIGPTLQRTTAFLGIKFSQPFKTTYLEGVYELKYSGAYYQQVRFGRMSRQIGQGFTVPPIRVKNPIGRDAGKAFAQISLLAMFGLKPGRADPRQNL